MKIVIACATDKNLNPYLRLVVDEVREARGLFYGASDDGVRIPQNLFVERKSLHSGEWHILAHVWTVGEGLDVMKLEQ